MNVRLYVWQRATAAVMVPLIAVHLAVIFYATRNGLTAVDILGRTLTDARYQRMRAVPHVSPAPKPLKTVRSPERSRPCASASSTANGIEPAEVFP